MARSLTIRFPRIASLAWVVGLLAPAVARAQETPMERARAHLDRGAFAEALLAADEVLAADPEDPEGHGTRGEALMGLGRWDDAVAACETALRKLPPGLAMEEATIARLCQAYLGKSRALFAAGEPLEALDAVDAALVCDVNFIEGILFRATLLENTGRQEEAEREVLLAVQKAPGHPGARTAAARLLIRGHRYVEALPHLDRILEGSDPPASPALLSWACVSSAQIRLERGDRALAWKHLSGALALTPDDPEARRLFAQLDALRLETDRVLRAERWILAGCIATLALYVAAGVLGWRVLKRRGLA